MPFYRAFFTKRGMSSRSFILEKHYAKIVMMLNQNPVKVKSNKGGKLHDFKDIF